MSFPPVRYSAATHVGLVRKINEDSVVALPDQNIFAVSDGMGGHAAGDFASRLIADCLAMMPDGLDATGRMHATRSAIQRAHERILEESASRGGATIGATVVALLIADGRFLSFWAGDSRLYRLRDNVLEMLTTDHSVVAALVVSGDMTWDEAEMHPQSNQITNAVGVSEELELDKIRGDVRSGDRFLLCSDGLTKYAGQSTLHRLLSRTPMETISDTLIQTALDGGGADNISVIVVDVL